MGLFSFGMFRDRRSKASEPPAAPAPTEPNRAPWDMASPYCPRPGEVLTRVRFAIPVGVYQRGECAGFDGTTTDFLVDSGVAIPADEALDAAAEALARARREARREQHAARVGLLDRAAAALDGFLSLSPEAAAAIDEAIAEAQREENAAGLRARCLRNGGAFFPDRDA